MAASNKAALRALATYSATAEAKKSTNETIGTHGHGSLCALFGAMKKLQNTITATGTPMPSNHLSNAELPTVKPQYPSAASMANSSKKLTRLFNIFIIR